jgi:hypothetical protein
MKAFLAFLVIVMVALSGFNYWQIHELKDQVARLEIKVQEQQSTGMTDKVVAEATQALASAKDAITRMDTTTARNYAESAKEILMKAGKTASEKASPTVKWLEGQARDLGKQIQDKVNSSK